MLLSFPRRAWERENIEKGVVSDYTLHPQAYLYLYPIAKFSTLSGTMVVGFWYPEVKLLTLSVM